MFDLSFAIKAIPLVTKLNELCRNKEFKYDSGENILHTNSLCFYVFPVCPLSILASITF